MYIHSSMIVEQANYDEVIKLVEILEQDMITPEVETQQDEAKQRLIELGETIICKKLGIL